MSEWMAPDGAEPLSKWFGTQMCAKDKLEMMIGADFQGDGHFVGVLA